MPFVNMFKEQAAVVEQPQQSGAASVAPSGGFSGWFSKETAPSPMAGNSKVAPTQKQFWNSMVTAAKESGAKFPELVAAQAALESGWGKRESGKFNYFGQKATRSQAGRDVTTHEEIGGRKVKMPQRFRDYTSVNEALTDHLRLWQSKYSMAKDARAAARMLQSGDRRYATDSSYVQKIESILEMQGY